MKVNFKVALPKEKNNLPLLKEVLSKGGFVKLTPGITFYLGSYFSLHYQRGYALSTHP